MKKRYTGNQIVAKLRQADVLIGKGKTVPECLSGDRCLSANLLSLATEIWRYESGNDQGTAGVTKGKCPTQESGGRPGFR